MRGSTSVLALVDSPSQLSPARVLAQAVAGRQGALRFVLLRSGATPSEAQVRDAQLGGSLERRSLADVIQDPQTLRQDAIVALLTGSRLLALRLGVERDVAPSHRPRRPLLVTGYNGIVYEYEQEGLLWRLGFDLICVNSEADRNDFAARCELLGFDPCALHVAGVLMASSEAAPLPSPSPPRAVCFATQAVVPRRRLERIHVLERLVEYARRFPERRVIIKPRTRPGERTFHVERYHYASLWEEDFAQLPQPANLEFDYRPLGEVLQEVDLVISISSTAVFEALSHGVQAGVLEDFGLRERLGTHFFSGSGLVTNFSRLLDDALPSPDPEWLRREGFIGDEGLVSLATRVVSMLEAQRTSGMPRPLPPVYYDQTRTPLIYAEALEKLAEVTKEDGDKRSRISTTLEDALDTAHRKARKLVRSPRAFFDDMRIVKRARDVFGDDRGH